MRQPGPIAELKQRNKHLFKLFVVHQILVNRVAVKHFEVTDSR